MQKWQQWETGGEGAWGVALQRERVIRPLAEQLRRSAESVAEAACQLGLSRSVLYELLQRYRRPQTSSLLPWKRGRKPNESLLGDEREALLNTCIAECYLRPERPSLAALHLEVRRRFAERVLAVPTCRTVRRQVEAVDARTALRRQRTKTLPILVVNGSFALLAGYGCACEIERPRYGNRSSPPSAVHSPEGELRLLTDYLSNDRILCRH